MGYANGGGTRAMEHSLHPFLPGAVMREYWRTVWELLH
jgi:hypothetical protein